MYDDAYILNMRKEDEDINNFIERHMPLLLNRASKYAKKYYTLEYDVILSILMSAFHEAITKFKISSGHFYPLAEGVMQRRIIDEFRKTSKKTKMKSDISFNQAKEGTKSEDALLYESQKNGTGKNAENENYLLMEIEQLEAELREFDISYEDLPEASPKQRPSMKIALSIVEKILDDKATLKHILTNKRLSEKRVSDLTHETRAFIKKSKSYLIALILVKVNKLYLLEKYLFSK